jgi:polysaccharide chain length determinant protein (PEP-CTERM system associated)
MINSQHSFNIYVYIDIFLKRIWYFIIPLVLAISGTVAYLMVTPKWYRSSTLVLVSPQKIPPDYVKATVTSSVAERLQSIAQEIMSRTRLEQIILELKLYPEKVKTQPMEAVVEAMRKDISIDMPKGRDKEEKNYFSISFVGKDPKVVAAVTGRLASLFIEENLKIREQQAAGTTEFLESELKAAKEKVDKAQAQITAYKRQYINELPENREANLRVLEQLRLQDQKILEAIKAAEDRKLLIQNQLANLPYTGSGSLEGTAQSSAPTGGQPPLILQLSRLRALLEDLQSRYTDSHPDIKMTKKKIAELEKALAAGGEGGGKGTGRDPVTEQYHSFQETRKAQLAQVDREIQRLKKEEEKIRSMISLYQSRIDNTPIRELALSSMLREFQNLNDSYQILLKKNTEAQQAENLERRQKGEQFRIIDPARIPEKPFKPDVFKVSLIGLVLGLAGGLGLVFVREQLDHSFRDAEDVETTLGLKVLANIPKIEQEAA